MSYLQNIVDGRDLTLEEAESLMGSALRSKAPWLTHAALEETPPIQSM